MSYKMTSQNMITQTHTLLKWTTQKNSVTIIPTENERSNLHHYQYHWSFFFFCVLFFVLISLRTIELSTQLQLMFCYLGEFYAHFLSYLSLSLADCWGTIVDVTTSFLHSSPLSAFCRMIFHFSHTKTCKPLCMNDTESSLK